MTSADYKTGHADGVSETRQELGREIERLRANEAVCHCGELISAHHIGSGHSAVEMPHLCPYEQERDEARRIARWLRQSYEGPAYDLLTDEEQGWLDTMDQWSSMVGK